MVLFPVCTFQGIDSLWISLKKIPCLFKTQALTFLFLIILSEICAHLFSIIPHLHNYATIVTEMITIIQTIKKQNRTFQNQITKRKKNYLPVLTPESKFRIITPVVLHGFVAFKSRIRIPQKKSEIQNTITITTQTWREKS